MMKHCLRWVAPAAALALLTTGALAQFPNLTPQQQQIMEAKRKKWQAWRENHKGITALSSTLFGLGALDKDPKLQLNKNQAKQILAVLKAWRTKPVMTDDQARAVNKKISAVLTDAQLQKISTERGFGRGGRGFGGGARPGGGGPGGGGPGGGRPGGFDPTRFPDPKDYNPLNPDSNPMAKMSPEVGQRMKARFGEMMSKLEARAK
jgi:hypothetical protein